MTKYYHTKKRKRQLNYWKVIIACFILGVVIIGMNQRFTEYSIDKMSKTSEASASGNDTLAIIDLTEIIEPTQDEVKTEIVRQANNFNLDPKFMLALADCESDYKYNAHHQVSTACGVYQYLLGTWAGTESSKKGISCENYKANIREAMVDVSNGELWRWGNLGTRTCMAQYNYYY